MAGSHIGFSFNIEDLKSEQVDIDKLIDSLLNNNTASSPSPAIASQNRRGSEAPNTPTAAPVKSRGPGRPRTAKATIPKPLKSPIPVLTEDTPLNVIVDCLNKINLQNKKLLEIVESIVVKVESACEVNKDSSKFVSVPDEAPAAAGTLIDVNSRLEKLEQNVNQNTLICRGTAVEALIKESEENGKPSLERLKGDLCKSACGEEATNINISEVKVSVFGKARRAVKVECPNLASKVHIIRKARERKPQGLYVNEFLTESKLKLFLKARALKKLHPSKIKAVFTRGGSVCYSLANTITNRFYHINTIEELRGAIGLDLSGEEERAG